MSQRNRTLRAAQPGCHTQNRLAGFSLIELMISIALGLLIMTTVLTLYLSLSRSNAELAKMNRQIENGRFTIQLLQQELWRAGFWDSYVPPSPSIMPPTAIPNPCVGFSSWDAAYIANLYAIPVQGYVAGSALPVECSSMISNQQADSDVLVVRHAAACVADTVNCEAGSAGKLYLQTQACGVSSHANYVASAATTPMLGTAGTAVYKKDCTTLADKRKLVVSIFYIRNYSVNSGDGIPTLMRADMDLSGGSVVMQAAQPVIEGIQSLRLEYGQDTNEDGSVNIFSNCATCTAADWANVVAVRIHVLARNLDPTTGYVDNKSYVLGATTLGPFNDGFMRHAYSSYVRLINPSGRREMP